MKVGITGAGGFVGSGLIKELLVEGHEVYAFSSRKNLSTHNAVQLRYYSYSHFLDGKLTSEIEALDIMIIAHGIAHTRDKKDIDIAYKINYSDVLKIAEISAKLDVKKFIFISSASASDKFNDVPKIRRGKKDNAQLMNLKYKVTQELFSKHGDDYQIIILQPVLMYGPKLKGSLLTLQNIVKLRLPLPFKGTNSRRCYLSLKSFGQLICRCIISDLTQKEIFIVSDENPITIRQLIDGLSESDAPKMYFFIWPRVLRAFLFLLGKHDIAEHLYKDLVTDLSQVKLKTGWQPVTDTVRAIRDEI